MKKLEQIIIFTLGIGLVGVNSSLAEAAGILSSEDMKGNKSEKESRNYPIRKADTFKTFAYKSKKPDVKIGLPDEYNGKEAKYNHEEDGWTEGVLKKDKEDGLWYWLEDDFSDNKILIAVGSAADISIKGKTIESLFPELVYEITERNRLKQGDKIIYQAKIYGNKGDEYKVILKDKNRKTVYSSRPKLIREDTCMVNYSLRTSRKMKVGNYDLILAVGDQKKKQRIYIEAK